MSLSNAINIKWCMKYLKMTKASSLPTDNLKSNFKKEISIGSNEGRLIENDRPTINKMVCGFEQLLSWEVLDLRRIEETPLFMFLTPMSVDEIIDEIYRLGAEEEAA